MQRTGKGQGPGESDIPKWQAEDDYISRGTGFGECIYVMISNNVILSRT